MAKCNQLTPLSFKGLNHGYAQKQGPRSITGDNLLGFYLIGIS